MRLPFISRRRAQAAVTVATAAIWHMVDDADKRTGIEIEARLDAEHDLADARKAVAVERAKRERLKAYMRRTHAGRYELRLARALRAVAELRAEAEVQRRATRRLTDQLLDATGYRGEPLLPAARTLLDLTEEDTK